MTVHRARRERGAASLAVVGVFVAGMVLAVGAAHAGAALLGRAHAQTAADAAALAAADALALGGDPGRAASDAATTAADNGARLVECRCDGPRVAVTVERAVPLLGRVARVSAAAEVRGLIVPSP